MVPVSHIPVHAALVNAQESLAMMKAEASYLGGAMIKSSSLLHAEAMAHRRALELVPPRGGEPPITDLILGGERSAADNTDNTMVDGSAPHGGGVCAMYDAKDLYEMEQLVLLSQGEARTAKGELLWQSQRASQYAIELASLRDSLSRLRETSKRIDGLRHGFKCLSAACLVILEADARLATLWTLHHWSRRVMFIKRGRWAIRIIAKSRAKWGLMGWKEGAVAQRLSRNTVLGDWRGDKEWAMLHRSLSLWWHEAVFRYTSRIALSMIRAWRNGCRDLRRAKSLLTKGRFKTRIRLLSRGFRRLSLGLEFPNVP